LSRRTRITSAPRCCCTSGKNSGSGRPTRRARIDAAAVAQHGDLVGDREHLVHAVRDVDDGHAAVAQAADDLEHLLDFVAAQRGGRLVHQQHLGIDADGLGNLQQLALGDAQATQQALRVEHEADLGQPAASLLAHRRPVQPTQRVAAFAPEKEVLVDAQLRHLVELLMDDRNAQALRVARVTQLQRHAVELDHTLVAAIDAGHDLQQRRLARAVFADQRMHFAAAQREVHLVQRLDAGKTLADPARAQPDWPFVGLRFVRGERGRHVAGAISLRK
jgi:hypothetical protein